MGFQDAHKKCIFYSKYICSIDRKAKTLKASTQQQKLYTKWKSRKTNNKRKKKNTESLHEYSQCSELSVTESFWPWFMPHIWLCRLFITKQETLSQFTLHSYLHSWEPQLWYSVFFDYMNIDSLSNNPKTWCVFGCSRA